MTLHIFLALVSVTSGFTVQIKVTRVVSGNTIVTSDDDFVHIVGEDGNMQPYVFSCLEPEATQYAETILFSNRVTMAYRGRHETGVKFGVILVDGLSYPEMLEKRRLVTIKSPEAFSDKVTKTIYAPSSWMPAPRPTTATRRPSVLGEFYRGMAKYMESLQFSGSSQMERNYNSYVRGLASEYRKVATVADKPSNQFTAKDARSLWDSAERVNKSTQRMEEQTIREWNKTFGIE